ncbi:hypothetical protein FPV67DRAFT_14949 [Lyophyllum atratum]|nr:hypothetical protein FPV67DRAFT_14949 [Lyophyllum atratum]
MSTSELVLHVWPARWNLPTTEPSCLAAVMYLQQAIPGKFTVAECNNPDLSPSGLRNAENTRTSPNLDASLNTTEKSQTIAWCAHIESNLGDIISNVLYSHQDNWVGLTHPALASMYPLPQRYYIPGRIRQSYKPRLEAAGLWNLNAVDGEENQPFRMLGKKKEENTKVFQQAFGREKVCSQSPPRMLYYNLFRSWKRRGRLLTCTHVLLENEISFIWTDPRPWTSFLQLTILLLIDPPYPDPFIQNLIKDSYPILSSHARRVYTYVFGSSGRTITSLLCAKLFVEVINSLATYDAKQAKQTDEDIHFTRMRWGFYGVALGSLAVYIVSAFFMARPRHPAYAGTYPGT